MFSSLVGALSKVSYNFSAKLEETNVEPCSVFECLLVDSVAETSKVSTIRQFEQGFQSLRPYVIKPIIKKEEETLLFSFPEQLDFIYFCDVFEALFNQSLSFILPPLSRAHTGLFANAFLLPIP
jgi:hypothetical protein